MCTSQVTEYFYRCSFAKLSIATSPFFYSVLCVKIVEDFLQYLFVIRLLLLCWVLFFPCTLCI